MSDYNIELKFRNGPLVHRMREYGYTTVAQLSRASGISQSHLGNYLNLKKPPISQNGVSTIATRLADFLHCEVEDLFPADHLYNALAKNKAEIVLSIDDVRGIMGGQDPIDLLSATEESDSLYKLLDLIPPRQREVVSMRLGLEGPECTMKEIAEKLDITASRVAQIEKKAFRRLRWHASQECST